ncbi:hypothetical protein PybrP1_012905 [[Pythium] brassicae (nom. inval.)]|nr:hypothetical protein PybrP1_012905 [[Pythium] brassicae (nom. inval.)]
MGESPLFRVGDDVELWLMLFNFTVLALAVTAFEKVLHALEKRLERYPKYHHMVTKVYRELMILGILGLGIKMLKEAGLIKETSPETIAFVSADLTLFFLALSLIFQAVTIFLQLRWENKHMATLELLGSEELYARAAAHERRRSLQSAVARAWTGGRFDEAVRVRVLRNLFLRAHALPEIFPFAKYLREAQDNQISHMIDIELVMWLVVFGFAWAFYASIDVLKDLALFGGGDNADDNSADDAEHPKSLAEDARKHMALAVVFTTFVWLLLLLHVLVTAAFDRALRKLLRRAGVASKAQSLERLKQVAAEEAANLASEVTGAAISRMQDVLEEQQVRQHKRHHKQLAGHERGPGAGSVCASLVQMLRRDNAKLGASASTPSTTAALSPTRAQAPMPAARESDKPAADAGHEAALRVPGFSWRLWHFCVMLFLILNGLFSALFVQAIMYHMPAFASALGVVVAALIPLPLVVNWYVQPKMIRKFILVSSLAEVHVGTLSSVISSFTESVELQNTFISLLLGCLEDAGVTFTSVMGLLFQVQHLKVDYRKVMMLIRLASSQHDDEMEHPGAVSGLGHSLAASHTFSRASQLLQPQHQHQQHHLRQPSLLLPEPQQRGTSFIAMLDGSSRDFARSTMVLHDAHCRPSRLTRQMMEAGSSQSVAPAFRRPGPAASFVSSASFDSLSSSVAILGASGVADGGKSSRFQGTGGGARLQQQQYPPHHFQVVSESTTLEEHERVSVSISIPTSNRANHNRAGRGGGGDDRAVTPTATVTTPSSTESRYHRI